MPQSKARKREYMREYMRLWRSLWGGEGSIVKSDPPNKSVSPFVSERGVVIVNPVSPLLVPVGAFRGSRAAETALAYMTYINARGYTLTDGPPYRLMDMETGELLGISGESMFGEEDVCDHEELRRSLPGPSARF